MSRYRPEIQTSPIRRGVRSRASLLLASAASLLVMVGAHSFEAAPATPAPVKPVVDKASFPGLANPGNAVSIGIQSGSTDEPLAGAAAGSATLRGPDARLQLIVSGKYDSGQMRDWTRLSTYTVAPATILKVDANGAVLPLADGKATITAKGPTGLVATVNVTVEKFAHPDPINFANQVVPIFTKLGCNSGGCHGKSGGQNGFRLSLLGFEPNKDFQYLVRESRGRRMFPAAPAESLLLMKSTNQLAHGGGEKLKPDSADYRVIYRWISQGMPYGTEADAKVSSLSVYPHSRILPPDGRQQLKVLAHYTDGSVGDVSHNAQYEPNDKEMAEIDKSGYVGMMNRPGDVAVMVRYQGQVATFGATVPLGAPVNSLPKPRNYIDELVFEKLKDLGLPPSALCDDATFLRRVSLDVIGRLPTIEEAKAFADDKTPAKRDTCIDRLLASDDYAEFFAAKWGAILRNKREKETYQRGNYLFHDWIKQNLLANKPYDQFVRELLTAAGDPSQSPAVSWYRQVKETNEQVEDTAQLFLGVRIQCARCHHHPFEKWSQNDYYGMAAFFSTVGQKDGDNADEFRIYHKRAEPMAKNPNTEKNLKPTALGAEPMDLSIDEDPRAKLVDWMVQKQNVFFSKSLTNRYWKHFFGRGLVDPEDDMRETNPPSNPKLLAALAENFTASKYDLKSLVRTVCQSQTYQLSATPNAFNQHDKQSYSRFFPRRLGAEVLLDAIDQMNGTKSNFTGMPEGSRAIDIPDHGGVNSYFLQVFGRPAGSSACECERAGETSLAQSLHLLNSGDIFEKLSTGRAKLLTSVADVREDSLKVTDLYFAAFSRAPSPEELHTALTYIASSLERQNSREKESGTKPDKRVAYEDLVWVLINTKEFLFNH